MSQIKLTKEDEEEFAAIATEVRVFIGRRINRAKFSPAAVGKILDLAVNQHKDFMVRLKQTIPTTDTYIDTEGKHHD